MSEQRYSISLPSVGELKALAAGRWFDILIAAGIDADKLDGRGHACPKCGGRDRFVPDGATHQALTCDLPIRMILAYLVFDWR